MPRPLSIRVQCYAGHRAEETPRSLLLGDRRIEVTEILDRWISPEHRYFKVRGSDGALYIVRHDTPSDSWELVFYKAGEKTR